MIRNYLIGGLAAALVVTSFVITKQRTEIAVVSKEAAEARASYASERADAATQLAMVISANRTKETELRTEFSLIEKAKDDQITIHAATAQRLTDRLRNSETKSATLARELSKARASTGTQEAPSGSNQREVLGEFGEADVAEAVRADLIRVNLIECYRKYDELANKLK